jgi:hypothetical protein
MAIAINTDGQPSSTIPDLLNSNKTLYPEYKCRAWVNFNGTGTVAIRGSGNVSSITDNGTGDYNINFTMAMPDVNYCIFGESNITAGGQVGSFAGVYTTTTYNFLLRTTNGTGYDDSLVSTGVFR